jgi:pimeloyl-ACP methyl ester carboxylesterase
VESERVRQWRLGGDHERFRGRSIFVRRRDGGGPPLVLLHGFPSSSFDWRRLLELERDRASLAFDFLGFGLSDKPRDFDYTLTWQADLTEALAEGLGPVVVLAHDIGTSVATELMARAVRGDLRMELAGVLMLNGSILQDAASPTIGQRILAGPLGSTFARLTSERGFRVQFGRIFSDAHPLSADEAADQWELLSTGGGNRIMHLLIRYMDERRRLAERWHGAFRDWGGDVHLAWGMSDPVATPAVLAGLRELRPGVPVRELPDVGHYPQVEVPEAVAAALTGLGAREA